MRRRPSQRMKPMRALVMILVVSRICVPTHLLAQTWDPAPLRSQTPTPKDGLPPDKAAFFHWLRTAPPSGDDVEKARERIYTYVSEMAKRGNGAFPAQGDSAAIPLFRAAVELGVPGADQVVEALDPRSSNARVPVPSGITLSFHRPVFSLGSDDSTWAVCFPYYFMPAPVGRQTPNNGVKTEIAVLSTLVAPDSSEGGSSQATIFIAAAPRADSSSHVTLWIQRFGVAPVPARDASITGQWYQSPEADLMRREVVVRQLPQRIVLIAYVGLRGTFESNRPHFLDLLHTLAPKHCAA